MAMETLTIKRKVGDQITLAHLHRLAHEGWHIVDANRTSESDYTGDTEHYFMIELQRESNGVG